MPITYFSTVFGNNRIALIDYRSPLAERAKRRRFFGPSYWYPSAAGWGRGFYLATRQPDRVLRLDRPTSTFDLRIIRPEHCLDARGEGVYRWDDEEYQPIVFRLPKGRGYLSGWTLGEGMCGSINPTSHRDLSEAMHDAREEARLACERSIRAAEEQWREAEGVYADG